MKWDITAKIQDDTKPSTAEITVKDLKTNVTVSVSVTNLDNLDESIMDAMTMVENIIKSLNKGS